MMNLFIFPTNTCFGIATPIDDIDGYNAIYNIKNRDFDKPLAILVDNYEYFEKNTILNNEQIDFLKKYDKPFTILTNVKTNIISDKIKNKNIYKKIAFRIAHNFMQKKLIRLNGPLFLTSANRSGECELFATNTIKDIFSNEIKKYNIKVLAHQEYCINSKQKSSDIIEFIGDSLEIIKYR